MTAAAFVGSVVLTGAGAACYLARDGSRPLGAALSAAGAALLVLGVVLAVGSTG